MDNLTHSLVGVALADLAMGKRATKGQRPLFVGAGIIAANFPDVDVAFSRITPFPLGYLLHHRGHTHTIAGLGVQAVVLLCAYWFFPSLKKMGWSGRLRFGLLIAVALASHIALDVLNSYGVHPFYPFDNTWYFGDAVFIFEPFLWLIFGVAVAANARTRTARLAAALPLLVLLFAISSSGLVPFESLAVLAIVGGAFAWFAIRVSPRVRAAVALALCGLFVAASISASRVARRDTMDALRSDLRGQVVDVALTPNPSSPLCWWAIAIEMREASDEYVLWRGTISLAPTWKAPTACASHRLVGGPAARVMGDGRFVVRDEIHQPLGRLRALATRDCWVRAWLRFGRAPVIDGGWIFDLRFSELRLADRDGRNFSHLRIDTRRDGCPAHVPEWAMPREDILQAVSEKRRTKNE